MRRFLAVLFYCALLCPARVAAQSQQPATDARAFTQERLGENHYRLTGAVEVTMPGSGAAGESKLYADGAEIFYDETEGNRVVAIGNVVLTQGNNRISADRGEFNTKTRLGIFYRATGIATLQPQRNRPQPGQFAAPTLTNQESDVYFYGDTVEKIGPQKYKITNGGFTTCVQPTPRWQLTSGTAIVNVDHYTFLKNATFTVKGVPFLYLPVLYYPTKKDDRATGFLIPTYGSSSIRGQSLHNGFFWAVNRSQDATFTYDWFSKTGQGVGSEYRYNYGPGENGVFRGYFLNEHETTYPVENGTATSVPGTRSYELRGGLNQQLPLNLRARANIDYFSSLQVAQTFNTNIYDATRRQRVFGGNVVGLWGTWTFNGTFDRNEYFTGDTQSTVTGSTPRLALTRSERPLLGSPLYFSFGSELAHLVAEWHDTSKPDAPNVTSNNLSRVDFAPQLRYPFKRWQWFTVNSTLSWRDTYYTRSYAARQDPNAQPVITDEGISRQFFTLQAQLVGPVLTRIWNTPDNGYAEKFKHTIEPYLTIGRTSNIENFGRIVQIDPTDAVVGGTTQYTYGVNNRFYAKRRQGRVSQARDIVDVELTQTYYTNQLASQYDVRYATSFTGAAPSNFSPVALTVRAMPTNDFTGQMRAEFDSKYHSLRTITAGLTYNVPQLLQTTVSWSKKAFIPGLLGFNDRAQLDHYINTSTNVHASDNRIGAIYAFNFDVLHSSLLNQSVSAYYNAQCCGVAMQYQTFNYGAGGFSPIPSDHRFFLSFTLAGIGNFSPFNGAMSGVPH